MLLLNLELSERPRHGAICTAKEREHWLLGLAIAIATPCSMFRIARARR